MSEFGPVSNNPEEQVPRVEIIRRLTEREYNTPLTNGGTLEELYTDSYGSKGEGWDVIFENDVSIEDKLRSIETATAHDEFMHAVASTKDENITSSGFEKSATHGPLGVIVVFEKGKLYNEEKFGKEG